MKRELRTDSEPVIVDDAQLADDRRGGILNPRQCLLEQRLPYAVHVEGIEVLDDRGVARADVRSNASGLLQLTDQRAALGLASEAAEQERRDGVVADSRHGPRLAGESRSDPSAALR